MTSEDPIDAAIFKIDNKLPGVKPRKVTPLCSNCRLLILDVARELYFFLS